jgi:uncharacterized protein with HEPN domain
MHLRAVGKSAGWSSVELRSFSEASRRLPDDLKERNPDIPWRKAAGIGKIIRHNYERIAPDLLWKMALDDLPALQTVCRAELARALARERDD